MATEKRLIYADALLAKFKEHRDLYAPSWEAFKASSISVKCRVDEIDTCMADVINAPTVDAVEVVRCKKCINGIYDEANNIYKCVKSADYDPEYDDWLGFVSYHNADYYCADGERRTDGR